ncbi:aprataxin and PNK-like factor isoform X2 [Coregonus clupeaformis]|uniref:aprataxin and PNK-like factor isoform X2 n=1 Tax=Coregonus clupeaformis TaxID=59861 RepID=UPI001E1C8750|nr:aprataxin and PNK-like factor isoform X2 [Coregonus clupeaformis]XP_045068459.1 aprataxin and PNK-like factor isoform X2 [Coregonus clupeaformis]
MGSCASNLNSQALQDEEEAVIKSPPASPKPSDEPANHTRQGKGWTPRSHEQESRLGGSVEQKEPDEQLPNRPTSNQTETGVAEAEKDKNEPKLEPKKRVLPAWMMVPIAAPKSPTTKVLGDGNRGRGTATRTTSTNQGVAKRARDTAPLSGEEESEHSEAEPTPRKRVRRKKSDEDEDDDEEEEVQSKTAFKARQQVKPSKVEESEESDHFDVEEEEDDGEKRRGGGGEASTSKGSSTSTSRAEARESEDRGRQPPNGQKVGKGPQGAGDVSGPAQSKARLRTTCPYGKDCYRKNPVHFQECSHPGDSDYEEDSAKEEEEEEDADRPECPYGTDCYRKNPLHWKEYKHTKKTRAKKPVSYNNDDDDDEFGDDDSFINDESEDIGEDSDYEPPDSDDSGKEDLKRLKKEAKAFTKPK